jgi:hypothetical protein
LLPEFTGFAGVALRRSALNRALRPCASVESSKSADSADVVRRRFLSTPTTNQGPVGVGPAPLLPSGAGPRVQGPAPPRAGVGCRPAARYDRGLSGSADLTRGPGGARTRREAHRLGEPRPGRRGPGSARGRAPSSEACPTTWRPPASGWPAWSGR